MRSELGWFFNHHMSQHVNTFNFMSTPEVQNEEYSLFFRDQRRRAGELQRRHEASVVGAWRPVHEAVLRPRGAGQGSLRRRPQGYRPPPLRKHHGCQVRQVYQETRQRESARGNRHYELFKAPEASSAFCCFRKYQRHCNGYGIVSCVCLYVYWFPGFTV